MLTYSLDEAARRIGGDMSPRRLARGVRHEGWPARRVGRALRLTDSDIHEILDRLKTGPSLTTTSRRRTTQAATTGINQRGC